MELVAAALEHGVDDAAHGAAVLGLVAAGVDVHLREELGRQVGAAREPGLVGLEVAVAQARDVQAVDDVDVLEARRAADRDVAAAVDEGAGRLVDDGPVVRVDRHVEDEVLVERRGDARGADVDRGRLARDDVGLLRGGLRLARDLGVHAHGLLGQDAHALLLDLGRRVGEIVANGVRADGEAREEVLALPVRDRRVLSLRALHDDGDARERRARVLIGHGASDPAGGFLRPRRGAHGEHRQGDNDRTENAVHLASLSGHRERLRKMVGQHGGLSWRSCGRTSRREHPVSCRARRRRLRRR